MYQNQLSKTLAYGLKVMMENILAARHLLFQTNVRLLTLSMKLTQMGNMLRINI